MPPQRPCTLATSAAGAARVARRHNLETDADPARCARRGRTLGWSSQTERPSRVAGVGTRHAEAPLARNGLGRSRNSEENVINHGPPAGVRAAAVLTCEVQLTRRSELLAIRKQGSQTSQKLQRPDVATVAVSSSFVSVRLRSFVLNPLPPSPSRSRPSGSRLPALDFRQLDALYCPPTIIHPAQ